MEAATDGAILWPFGMDPAPFKGFIRSRDETRDEMIFDHGHGVRVYQSTTGEAPHVVNAQKRTCSSEYCQNLVGSCAHLWEDDFRFGEHANKEFILPPRTTRKRKDGEGWTAVERYIPRPNPDVDGRKFATLMKNARISMPQDSRAVLADVVRYLRGEEAKKRLFAGEPSRCGRPRADLYDVAMMAILRMGNNWSYERTQDEIDRLVAEGVLESRFRYPRINEAMMDLPLAGAVLQMTAQMGSFFRDVVTVGVMDGMILSTNKTDNARSGHFEKRPKSVLTELHVMYDIRWGIIMGFNLTWCARGRGSGEAPQYPFVLHDAKTAFPNLQMVQADLAYGSERNFSHSLARGITLLVPVRENAFKKPKILTKSQVETIRRVNDPNGPLIQQVFRFRNAAEGWN
jgi:hypothetical protein